jgi:hypothetical protein
VTLRYPADTLFLWSEAKQSIAATKEEWIASSLRSSQ